MPDFRPPDIEEDFRRSRLSPPPPRPAPKRSSAAGGGGPRLARWRGRGARSLAWLRRHPEAPLCLGLLVIAATMTVLRAGAFGSYSAGYLSMEQHEIPSEDAIRWIRFAGAALVVLGVYYRIAASKYKG